MKKVALWREGCTFLKNAGYSQPGDEGRFLLQHIFGQDSHTFYATLEDEVPEKIQKQFTDFLKRLAGGEPLAYILKSAEFMGLSFYVDEGVLIPRPETELLTEAVIEHVKSIPASKPVILDIGTGSGCILVSVAHFLPDGLFLGVDISLEALLVARKNAGTLCPEKKLSFLQMDCFKGLIRRPFFDVIVSNPPYVAENDPQLEINVKKHEPAGALFSGPQGRDHIGEILAQASIFLKRDGLLFMEIGYNLLDWSIQAARRFNYSLLRSIQDYQGITRHLVLKPR